MQPLPRFVPSASRARLAARPRSARVAQPAPDPRSAAACPRYAPLSPVTRPATVTLRRLGLAAVVFALVWLTLVRVPADAPMPDAWVVGVLAIGAALWTLHHGAMPIGASLRWTRLPALVALFLWQSLAGGVDVTRRVLSPRMSLRPGLIVMRLALTDEGARVLLALLVSLMPGTLAARLDGTTLTLHALDLRLPVEAETRHIEHLIAGLYGLDDRSAAEL